MNYCENRYRIQSSFTVSSMYQKKKKKSLKIHHFFVTIVDREMKKYNFQSQRAYKLPGEINVKTNNYALKPNGINPDQNHKHGNLSNLIFKTNIC